MKKDSRDFPNFSGLLFSFCYTCHFLHRDLFLEWKWLRTTGPMLDEELFQGWQTRHKAGVPLLLLREKMNLWIKEYMSHPTLCGKIKKLKSENLYN